MNAKILNIILCLCLIASIIVTIITENRVRHIIEAKDTEILLYKTALDDLLEQSRNYAYEYSIAKHEDRTDPENPRIWFEFNKRIIVPFDSTDYAAPDTISWGNK